MLKIQLNQVLYYEATEGGSENNNLGEIVFQGKNLAGDNHTYAFMRAESPVATDDRKKARLSIIFVKLATHIKTH